MIKCTLAPSGFDHEETQPKSDLQTFTVVFGNRVKDALNPNMGQLINYGLSFNKRESHTIHVGFFFGSCGNDPSAGSPTETLLRLHLPLRTEV